jgi:two-component system, NarL family, sensor histidine kinase UhpB
VLRESEADPEVRPSDVASRSSGGVLDGHESRGQIRRARVGQSIGSKADKPINVVSQALRLLLVEDSEDDALLLLRALRKGGYDLIVERVDTPDAVRAALDRHQWDLIISDYVIPGFGGLEALKLVKERGLDLPFIIVSGQIGEDAAVAAMKAGAHDYVMKDSLVRLVPAIGRELQEAEVRRARRQAGEALRESEERFRQLAENIDAAFFMSDWSPDSGLGKLTFISPAFETIWGEPCDALYKNPKLWQKSVHREDKRRLNAALARLGKNSVNEQFRIVRPNDVTRWVHYRAFPVRNERAEVYRVAAIAEDITVTREAQEKLAANALELQKMVDALQKAETELRSKNAALDEAKQQLEKRVQERTADLTAANAELQRQIRERRRLENELLDITEKERRRIGIDLHDDLGQHLNGIALLLEALQMKLKQKSLPEAGEVERVKSLLLKTMNRAHQVAHDLASVDLQSDDLTAALKQLATHAESIFSLECEFVIRGEIPSLPQNAVKQLYKIAQEAVTNAIKHGKARKVEMELVNEDDHLSLTVRNDGEPFPETLGLKNRMGLRIMHYRAHVIGGTVEVKGRGEEGGAVVTCSLPLQPAAEAYVPA